MARRTKRTTSRRRRSRRKGKLGWRITGFLVKWGIVVGVWATVLAGMVVGYYAYDLPDVDHLNAASRKPSITLTDRNGDIFATYGEYHAGPVFVQQLPDHLVQAVIAIEDRRFYGHHGVDFWGIARAAWANVRAGRFAQGGSTITQQLAKNLFLTPERTIKRKVQELLLALWLEHKFTKDQLLTIYLNRVYLGAGAYGVEAASRRYFGRSAREVSLYEGALLAGLLKAPSRYNPSVNPDLSRRRTAQVLNAMVDVGYISDDAADRAAAAGSPRAVARAPKVARHFADFVIDQVGGFIGGVGGRDLVVTTTIDLALQRHAQTQLATLLAGPGAKRSVTEGAVVTLGPDGAIRAMVGGRDYARSQFNRAVQAQRQPGSAFKLFVYLAALEDGFEPDTKVNDVPIRIEKWAPRNFDNQYRGEMTFREAAARSINSVAVQLSEKVGRDAVTQTAERLGVASRLHQHPSLALGANEVNLLELTSAYAVLANGGFGLLPYGITEIRDSNGAALYVRDVHSKRRVVGAKALAGINDLLRASLVWGTGKSAKLGRPSAGKTGTSQEFRDAWFVGYTADYVTGIWMGNDNGAPMKGVTGGGLPAQLWKSVMGRAHVGVLARALPVPAGERISTLPQIAHANSPEFFAAEREGRLSSGEAPQYGSREFNERIERRRQESR
ncbi:MAG: PBP1A family penicillin-binding protein [Alphaproteobacteria bacterium]|nr:PBP1A family penicillin-binding protein [Alphaproteobacteria bacterium]